MSAAFTYLRLSIGQGRQAQQDLDARLQALAPRLQADGGRLVGRFTAQLGWAANETAVLLQGIGQESSKAVRELVDAVVVGAAEVTELTPTARPAQEGPLVLAPGGIYVHRWFTVETPDLERFVDLSARAWPDFEGRFDTQIFGLFRASESPAEAAAARTRLLLLTRYADHGVWEASRDPSTEAMQIFAQRQLLTRHTIASSSLLVAP